MQSDEPRLRHGTPAESARALIRNVERVIHGKSEVIERAVVCMLAEGHLLLEDVPGVGKTTLASSLAQSIGGAFHRIQFTSDLLPSDLTGLAVPELVDGRPTERFRFQPGPIFANVVLADEVNRANPKSQSALLEAMSEGTVSVDGRTHALPDPFFVVATQNPLEHHGTHPLPESQLDRFMMRLSIGYPDPIDEAAVLKNDPERMSRTELQAVLDPAELKALQSAAREVKIDDAVVGYLLAIVEETRQNEALELGASTRGALALRRAAAARALTDGRDYCIPEDVAALAADVLAHRVLLAAASSGQAGVDEARWVLSDLLGRVPVPL
jgi:MoxR-like ATPase